MKKYFLLKTFRSNYCKVVFVSAIILFYFLIPKKIFYGFYSLLGIIFILSSSLVATCFIRIIKEKIISAKNYGSSGLGLIATIIGFTALQACGIGAPICGASLSAGLLAIFLPGVSFNFFEHYSLVIIILSIIVQISSLFFMNCFKK